MGSVQATNFVSRSFHHTELSRSATPADVGLLAEGPRNATDLLADRQAIGPTHEEPGASADDGLVAVSLTIK